MRPGLRGGSFPRAGHGDRSRHHGVPSLRCAYLVGKLRGIFRSREHSLTFCAGEDGASRALYACSVYVLGVVLDVHEDHLLRHPVEDMLGGLAAGGAEPVLAAQLRWQPAQAR